MKGLKPIKIGFILFILLLFLILGEAYLVYTYLYPNLNVQDESVPIRNVVRVDLKAYDSAIHMLNHLTTFRHETLNLARANPFKF